MQRNPRSVAALHLLDARRRMEALHDSPELCIFLSDATELLAYHVLPDFGSSQGNARA